MNVLANFEMRRRAGGRALIEPVHTHAHTYHQHVPKTQIYSHHTHRHTSAKIEIVCNINGAHLPFDRIYYIDLVVHLILFDKILLHC